MPEQENKNVNRPFHREGDAVVFDAPPDPKETARQRREDEQHEFARSQVKTNSKIAVFTFLLVVATFCTIAVGVWQGSISQKAANAARDSADAATLAANTAKESTELTRQSIAQAREQFSQDQRPYLGQDSLHIEAPKIGEIAETPGAYYIYWNYHYLNFGKTPAERTTIVGQMSLSDGPFEMSYFVSGKPSGNAQTSQPTTIAQEAHGFKTVFSKPLNGADARRLLSTPGAVRIKVLISYEGKTGIHYESAICMKYEGLMVGFCPDNYVH